MRFLNLFKEKVNLNILKIISNKKIKHQKISNYLKNKVLVILPDLPGSLGDEAMINSLIDNIPKNKGDEIVLVVIGNLSNVRKMNCNFKFIEIYDGINFFRFYGSVNKYYHEVIYAKKVILIGADMLDGFYSKYASLLRIGLLEIASKIKSKLSVVSFSFNKQLNSSIISKLKKLNCKFYVRDCFSYYRIKEAGLKNISQSMDVSFLLKSNITPKLERCLKDLDNFKKNTVWRNSILIGINPNKLISRKITPNKLVFFYVDLIQKILMMNSYEKVWGKFFKNNTKNSNFDDIKKLKKKERVQNFSNDLISDSRIKIVLLYHDLREENNDLLLCKKIYEAIPSNLKKNILIMCEGLSASEVRHYVSKLDLCVSSRMHLAISSISKKTPCIGIEYQDKFSGLFNFFNIDNFIVIPTTTNKTIDELLYKIKEALKNKNNVKLNIQKKLPLALKLARKNLR